MQAQNTSEETSPQPADTTRRLAELRVMEINNEGFPIPATLQRWQVELGQNDVQDILQVWHWRATTLEFP